MSIRYKLFGVFSIVIALACGLAFYGIHGISNAGDLVVRLYDGPLMGINHARSAHAALNAARLEMSARPARRRPAKDTVPKLETSSRVSWKTSTSCANASTIAEVKAAREKAESRAHDWQIRG